MTLVLLTTCDNSINANLIRTKLEAEGIPCVLNNENFTNIMPQFYNMLGSGVRVMVREEDLEQAKQIIQIDRGQLTCPNCHSTNVEPENKGFLKRLNLVFIGLFVSAIGNLLNNYVCKDCGHQFKKMD